ncbi:MAG: glycosyltransferase [Chloroflexi bacterium]|nr:glycosyltransferase [Chloroflexota bacterium]
MQSKQRILILMSDTGGGHRSAAEAIASVFARDFAAQYEVTLLDGIKHGARFPFNQAADWYLPMTTYAEPAWGALFNVSNRIAPTSLRVLKRVLTRKMRPLLQQAAPDLVVSVHPLLTTIPRRVLRALGSHAPFVVVITDLFSIHRLWLDREADLIIAPTQGAYEFARTEGIPPEKLRLTGLPVSLKFLANDHDQRDLRAKLGLDANRRTILLVGGGEGMGPLFPIARALNDAKLPAQLAVIAGRNKPLLKQLQDASWQIPVSLQGFVTNMPDWMRASDVIITKAGPGTIMEAVACGLPILLSGFLPGQEEGNVTFVERSEVGVLRREPSDIARTLREWLAPGNDTLTRFAARARELARPHAALDIASILRATLEDQANR